MSSSNPVLIPGDNAPQWKAVHGICLTKMHASAFVDQTLRCGNDRASHLVRFGAVYLHDGKRFRRLLEDTVLNPVDTVRIHPIPRRFPIDFNWRSRIRFEESEFLVIDKPKGIPVHATLDNAIENVATQIQERLGVRVFVTHRLDILSSGLLALAKTERAQARINTLFAKGLVLKRYRAALPVEISLGHHSHYMVPGERAPRVVLNHSSEGAQRCELVVERLEPMGGRFNATIRLLTGRTHQIRAQMKALGATLVGDALYGSPFGEDEYSLTACELGWMGWRIGLDP